MGAGGGRSGDLGGDSSEAVIQSNVDGPDRRDELNIDS
jgi:hypothetical protein